MKSTMNKIILIGLISLSFFSADYCTGAPGSGLSITGAVRQPLHVTIDDLAKYQNIQVQLNEVISDGGFHGVFNYQGVPLKILLELACIEKGDTGFASPIDLAIRVSNKKGNRLQYPGVKCFIKTHQTLLSRHRPHRSFHQKTAPDAILTIHTSHGLNSMNESPNFQNL